MYREAHCHFNDPDLQSAINASNWNRSQSEITFVEYRFGCLRAQIAATNGSEVLIIQFEEVEAFRVLDERDLPEFWPACSSATGGIFEIRSGGWLSQENQRTESTLAKMNPRLKEYLVTGLNECINVLTNAAPTIELMEPQKNNA